MFYFMKADKRRQCYPLCFIWLNTTGLPLTFYFMKGNKNRQLPLTFYLTTADEKNDSVTPYVLFDDGG